MAEKNVEEKESRGAEEGEAALLRSDLEKLRRLMREELPAMRGSEARVGWQSARDEIKELLERAELLDAESRLLDRKAANKLYKGLFMPPIITVSVGTALAVIVPNLNIDSTFGWYFLAATFSAMTISMIATARSAMKDEGKAYVLYTAAKGIKEELANGIKGLYANK